MSLIRVNGPKIGTKNPGVITVSQQLKLKILSRRFEHNLSERNENKIGQEILDSDPLVSVPLDSGNG